MHDCCWRLQARRAMCHSGAGLGRSMMGVESLRAASVMHGLHAWRRCLPCMSIHVHCCLPCNSNMLRLLDYCGCDRTARAAAAVAAAAAAAAPQQWQRLVRQHVFICGFTFQKCKACHKRRVPFQLQVLLELLEWVSCSAGATPSSA